MTLSKKLTLLLSFIFVVISSSFGNEYFSKKELKKLNKVTFNNNSINLSRAVKYICRNKNGLFYLYYEYKNSQVVYPCLKINNKIYVYEMDKIEYSLDSIIIQKQLQNLFDEPSVVKINDGFKNGIIFLGKN